MQGVQAADALRLRPSTASAMRDTHEALPTLVEVSGAGGRGQAHTAGGQAEESVQAAGRQDLGHLRARAGSQVRLRQQLVRLAEGDFVDRDVNVLAFGLPGTGKTHAHVRHR